MPELRNSTGRKEPTGGRDYFLAFVTRIKHENLYIREWLEYHLLVGVDHFFLYDMDGGQDLAEILVPYQDAGVVTRVPWTHYEGTRLDRGGPIRQNKSALAHRHFARHFGKRVRWVQKIDGDEFLYPLAGDDVVGPLRALDPDRVRGIGVPRFNFGHNGHDRRPPGLVIQSYLRREATRSSQKEWQTAKSCPVTTFVGTPIAGRTAFTSAVRSGHPNKWIRCESITISPSLSRNSRSARMTTVRGVRAASSSRTGTAGATMSTTTECSDSPRQSGARSACNNPHLDSEEIAMRPTHILTLVTSLVWDGGAYAQGPFDQTFNPDVEAPDGFRTNRTSYSAIMDVLAPSRPEVTQEQLAQLRSIPLEAIFGAVGEYRTNYARGFANTHPGERLVGRALTMRFLPPRPDLVRAANALAEEGDWDRRYYARAAEEAQPGDVVVAELGGVDGHNLFGDMGATGIQMRGAAGVVIDGGMRDLVGLQDDRFEGFPVLHRFSDPHTTSWLGVEFNGPVRIGGVTVLPGDIVVGDDGGVFFFPPELLDDVLEYAARSEAREKFQLQLLLDRRYRFRDVYPLSAALAEEFERTRGR